MREKIVKALETEAERQDSRILFAVESGSRAWGFASSDSDYDIRAAYVRPLDWYLGLEEGLADTWNAMLPHDLDIAAWDLRKLLRQFLKSNASLLEWIGSPIVYADCGLIGELQGLADRVFKPTHVAYHYASMFRHAIADRDEDGMISVKKLCYALRANAAVDWVVRRETMPPTAFAAVLEGIPLSADEAAAVEELLAMKERATEKERIRPDVRLDRLLDDRYDKLAEVRFRKVLPPVDETRKRLEALFRRYVLDASASDEISKVL